MQIGPEEDQLISLGLAYRAMFQYFSQVLERDGDLSVSLSELSLLADGRPADPMVWPDFLDAVQRANTIEGREKIRLRLSGGAA